jgi:hypothetical protein
MLAKIISGSRNMDDIFERASKKRDDLQVRRRRLAAALAEVEVELKEIDSFFAVASRLGANIPSQTETIASDDSPVSAANLGRVLAAWSHGTTAVSGVAAKGAVPHGAKTRLIVDSARDILRQHGTGLPARRILELMDRKGVGQVLVRGGRDDKSRIAYLSAVLSRDATFKSDRDAGGYVLAEEEAPPTEGQEGPSISQNDLLDQSTKDDFLK